MARALKPSVRAFVHEYVWGERAGNATECVKRVGLSRGKRKSQREYGCQLLRKPNVRELVDAQLAEKETLLKQKAVRVAEETYLLATADIGAAYSEKGLLLPLHEMPEDVRRAIAGIDVEDVGEKHGEIVKLKLHDKKAAQELFLKFAGKLKDKVELEGVLKLADLVPGLEKHDERGTTAGPDQDVDGGDEVPSPG